MPLVIRVSLRASHHRSEDCIWSQCETKTIARWMTAVNALQSLAMSTSAFKLLFDGDPYPELIQHVFHALFKKKKKRNAWQVALDISHASDDTGLLQHPWLGRRRRTGHTHEDTPILVRDMSLRTGKYGANLILDANKTSWTLFLGVGIWKSTAVLHNGAIIKGIGRKKHWGIFVLYQTSML
jgi:hypothetical protein